MGTADWEAAYEIGENDYEGWAMGDNDTVGAAAEQIAWDKWKRGLGIRVTKGAGR